MDDGEGDLGDKGKAASSFSYRYSGSYASQSYTAPKTLSQQQDAQLSPAIEDALDPSDYFAILRHSKDKTKLLYACNGVVQAVYGDTLDGNKCEETVQLAYQLMINHPLDSQIVQAAFEIVLVCNTKPGFQDSIEECEVYRPVLAAIKNHKQDPYFLGSAMETIASLAQSALLCKGLRQSQAFLIVLEVLEQYKYDVNVQTGGLLALSNVIQDDNYAQGNLVSRQVYKLISDNMTLHSDKPTLISNGFKALRLMCLPDHSRKTLLQSGIFEQAHKLLQSFKQNVDVVSSSLGLMEALSVSESTDFLDKATQLSTFPLIHSLLHQHPESIDVCVYGLSIIDHLCAKPLLLKEDSIKMESILRFMYSTFQQHGDSARFQEAFSRCLARLLEINSSLFMFVEDAVSGTGDETSQIRVPLLQWVWVVLLSSIHDTRRHTVYQAVSLAISYLVVDCDRLRRSLLRRGAAVAVFEGLRQFINLTDPKFEKCVQYGCQALVSLLLLKATEEKNFLLGMNAVYDLIDILERFVTAPDVAAEALSVIACLSDMDEFRATACKQNIHTRIMRLMQSRPNHSLLIESSLEVFIIFTELQPNMHIMLNDGKLFKEVMKILEKDKSESINIKCLYLIHKLATDEYLSFNQQELNQLCQTLTNYLATNTTNTPIVVEALFCIGHLCRVCPQLVPQLLVEYETELHLFNILFDYEENDFDSGDVKDSAVYELAIDNIHSLKLNEKCRQQMLLTAIRHKKIEAISLLIDIGADVNYCSESDFSDSPIYVAVLSKEKEVVECLLNRNMSNRQQMKEALALARVFELDEIIGVLLKGLGLDKQRQFLNFGGLDLVEIKPPWIYPSLGLRSSAQHKKHRRNMSMEHVADMINKRNSADNSVLSSYPLSDSYIALSSVTGSSPSVCPERGIKNMMFAGGIAMLPMQTDGDKSSAISKESLPPSRYNRHRFTQGASRPPDLPTVLSSPLATVKTRSMPSMMFINSDSVQVTYSPDEEAVKFMGSMSEEQDHVAVMGHDEVDYHSDDEGEIVRNPLRRHSALTSTGATYVPFNTLAKFRRASSCDDNPTSSITNLIDQAQEDGNSEGACQTHLGTQLVYRAALKTRDHRFVNSHSTSPFASSDEQGLADGFSFSLSLTLKESSNELKTLTQSNGSKLGEDLVDGPIPSPSIGDKTRPIKYLDISSNKLKGLDSLVESSRRIVKCLKDLITVDLKQNSLAELPSEIMEELLFLRRIVLSQNIFNCFPHELSLASKLVEVDISHNMLSSFPAKIFCFPNLQELNLSHNSLSVFPSCINGDQFPLLKKLSIESNGICYIEEKDVKLKNLEEMSLSKNSIKELPLAFLAGMTSLKLLDVSRNCLELLPDEAAEYMCKLQDLKLANNKLIFNEPQFQAFITTALVIQYVDANDNQLTSCPPPYTWRSRGLKHLLLGNNKLSTIDLSDCEKYWPHLERLVLADNKLKEIPPEIGKLRTLSCLDISHNKDIRHLPNEIGKLDYLFYLNLKGMDNLDVDIHQNARAIVRFLKSKLIESKPCYTMKMMVVGGAAKGKTTLLNLLINDQHKNKDNTATLGVNIRKWRYEHRPGVRYTINCWDFAGQEEFYSTHQCFLTPRSIYVLVYSLLKGESELESILSWLSNIQARAPDSQVIVVGTHKDMIPEDLFISVKKTMRTQIFEVLKKPGFPKDVTFAEISCIGKKSGLEALKGRIKEKIDSATLRKQKIMGEIVPASYLDLSDMLEEESRQLTKNKSGFKVITKKQLFEMMAKAGLDKKMDKVEVEQAVQFLHECGVLLHYDDIKSNLSDLYFLDPQWLCSIMSKVITIKQLTMISKGLLRTQDIPFLLKGSQFPQELIPEYIRLLEWFDVALRYSNDNILVPSFLPKEKPGPISLPPDGKIIRRYSLCFIPPGFWPRLITRLLYPRTTLQYQNPLKHMCWYSGVYSFWSLQSFFLIEQLETSKTTFDITVPNTSHGIRLLCQVVDNIEVLIDEWFPGLRNVNIVPGDMMVAPFALCPHCPAYNSYLFPMSVLVEQSKEEDSIKCPVHKEPVPLKLLAPDIIISDLDSQYHISYDDVILDDSNPASVIGKGGFGEVHKALYNGVTIAVKVFSAHSAEMQGTTPHQLIRQEVSILSQMNHPNIIKLVGIILRPKAMLLMEYAELGSLNTLSPYVCVSNNLKHRIAMQVASGLAFLHKNKVIYRDLKPGNILIFSLSFNAKVNAKLSDYGISTYATEGGLREDIGTAGYKAPELLKAKTSKMPYDCKVDIYSYGIVLFQLISNGYAPFEELTPYERDKAVINGQTIKSVGFYGGPPWPDMHDIIHHCLQYSPNDRPSAQEIFDRLCTPEFVSLRDIIPVHEGWEILCFAIRNYRDKDAKNSVPNTEVWMASCDDTQRSMLSCVNLSKKQSNPKGRYLPYNTLILCMVSVGSSMLLFGTNSGDIVVCDGFDESKEHKLASLEDSILCLSFVRAKSDQHKAYVFAGLANGSLVAYDQCVLQTSDARPDSIIKLNKGPVKGIKRLHGLIYVISALEVFVINLSTLKIERQWEACKDSTRQFLTCIEADNDTVWTAARNSPMISVWYPNNGSLIKVINTLDSLKTVGSSDLTHSPSSSLHSFQDPIMFRVTAMHLRVSAPSLIWVGLATGHIIVYDVTSLSPLMATRRHENPVRAIQTIRTIADERTTNVVLSCGLGFRARPGHEISRKESLDNHGVLLLWDCSMPHVKGTFADMIKEQNQYR